MSRPQDTRTADRISVRISAHLAFWLGAALFICLVFLPAHPTPWRPSAGIFLGVAALDAILARVCWHAVERSFGSGQLTVAAEKQFLHLTMATACAGIGAVFALVLAANSAGLFAA